MKRNWRSVACWTYVLVSTAVASTVVYADKSYSPYAMHNFPKQVYWGDTHTHTKISLDAYVFGSTLGAEEAYRFAIGETVISTSGGRVRLGRPLDFLVIADHAENIGIMVNLDAGNPDLLATSSGRIWKQRLDAVNQAKKSDPQQASELLYEMYQDGIYGGVVGGEAFKQTAWDQVIANAERFNDPGKFTAFIGYEWTSNKNLSGTYHRNVIFKDGAELVNQVVPFSALDSKDPEDLWAYLDRYERETGGEVLAIPHNVNWSAGQAFMLKDSNGLALNRSYASRRSRWEPLVEVTQIKGDSEAHPQLSPGDEFADYYTWTRTGTEDKRDFRQYEYARSGLKLGLGEQARYGVNPFKFGMIGGTDSHTSLPAVEENNFWGKFPDLEPNATRIMADDPFNWRMNAAGYTAVWATENTREALFAAMKRKEVYATTGPRMTVRFFGGWGYESDDAFNPDLAKIGYGKGVPMGGDLTGAPDEKAPSFLIRAVKDPDGANLDRVQVIKGWHDKTGELHEKIYNVALSDGREEHNNGKVPPVGSTVNIKDASYTNTIGDPELAIVWQDPDFDKDELAFYYVRVLEIPTPRWTAYDAKFFGLKDIPEEVPMVTQERAYTSPIWYTPE